MRALRVLRAGMLTTVQDLGRPGLAHLGVPRSGALDAVALRLANRLVGNPEQHAGLEVTLAGCLLLPTCAVTLAVTGAPVAVRVNRRVVDFSLPVHVPAGAQVDVGPALAGVRSYLAVCGGIDVAPVLGSRSTDTLSGLGPPPVADGDLLPVGERAGPPASVDVVPYRWPPAEVRLAVRLGPRHDWFTPEAVKTLLTSAYQVSSISNRVGARLTGPPLFRSVTRELPSEGVVLGAVQVPSDGQPLVFLADHPTTGGYPVVATVLGADLGKIAQAPPGTSVTFAIGSRQQ